MIAAHGAAARDALRGRGGALRGGVVRRPPIRFPISRDRVIRGELPALEPLDKISLNDSPDWQASGDFRDFFQGRDAALSFVGVDSNTGPLLVFIMPSASPFVTHRCAP